MKDGLTSWKDDTLYPAVQEQADKAFPEMSFTRRNNQWVSPKKLYGKEAKTSRSDKTIIRQVGRLLEQGGESVPFVDYVMQRNNTDFIGALNMLADVVGLSIPSGSYDVEQYKQLQAKRSIMQDANAYFAYCLNRGDTAKDVRGYLNNRGYSNEMIEAFGLGYLPSKANLSKRLKGKEYSDTQVEEFVDSIVMDRTHKLVIPFYSLGKLIGFKFRAIAEGESPKYCNMKGLDKSTGFYGKRITGGNVLIVEGEFDALTATYYGVNNVVATAGNSITKEQIEGAIRQGAKGFTICYDNEGGGANDTKVNAIIDTILSAGVDDISVCYLPSNGDKIDVDSYLLTHGKDEFQANVLNARTTYYAYRIECLMSHAKGLVSAYEQVSYIQSESVSLLAGIDNSMHRDTALRFLLGCDEIKELGISEASLRKSSDDKRRSRIRKEQADKAKALSNQINAQIEAGNIPNALDTAKELSSLQGMDKANEFEQLFLTNSEEALRNSIRDKVGGVASGYRLGGSDLILPSGALSIFAAPTSHGKTAMLINLAVNLAQSIEGDIHLFSFEESAESILIKALNCYANIRVSNNNRRDIEGYFKGGDIKNPEFEEKAKQFFSELCDTGKLRIHYCDGDAETLTESIRYLHKKSHVGAVLIDYMQLLNPSGKKKTYSRQEEMKEVCISLKDTAVDTGLPIIVAAQFNREVVNKLRLHVSKIGEAGDIERVGNLIVGMWNNFLKPQGTDSELKQLDTSLSNTIYCEVLKNRDGEVGLKGDLLFNKSTGAICQAELVSVRNGMPKVDNPF